MKNNKPFKIGRNIQWNWMGRVVTGKVEKIYFRSVAKTFRGNLFKRNGSKEMPAYLIQSSAGNKVLKLHSELSMVRRVTSP